MYQAGKGDNRQQSRQTATYTYATITDRYRDIAFSLSKTKRSIAELQCMAVTVMLNLLVLSTRMND